MARRWQTEGGQPRPAGARLRDRATLLRAMLAPPARGFLWRPDPESIGDPARGRQLLAGTFLFAGSLVEAPDRSIWRLPVPSGAFAAEIHGFGWLDDLAALGTREAAERAREWLEQWIARFGRGAGPGWAPAIAGRRLTRLIHHATFLLSGADRRLSRQLFALMARHAAYLARRWPAAPAGLARIEALTGLAYSALSLDGLERHADPALAALEAECRARIDSAGAIASRNPEELLAMLTHLIWVRRALDEAGRKTPREVIGAILRVTPTLRALRHSDGALARFHGGGRGAPGALDRALADSGVRGGPRDGLAMGFARLAAGRVSVIVDAAAPATGRESAGAHASTLAFELTSGRRPVIVSCGAGESLGTGWRRAGRATQSHSTLAIEGHSSARIGESRGAGGGGIEPLVAAPRDVGAQLGADRSGPSLTARHDGYAGSHGLIHGRRLMLDAAGRRLTAEDSLSAVTHRQRRAFDAARAASRLAGVAFAIRFHLHPDVDAELDTGRGAVSLVLASGEMWELTVSGPATASLEPSVYLARGRPDPRPTRQIVLSARLTEPMGRIGWTLAKAGDTPDAMRDLADESLKEPA